MSSNADDTTKRLDYITSQDRDNLFEQYIKECELLRSTSPNTIRSYRFAYERFGKVGHPTDSKSAIAAILALRESGLSASSVNAYIRCYSAFLSWLMSRGDILARFPMKSLPEPKKVKPVFDVAQALAILRCKPKTIGLKKIQAMFAVAIDTALRFGELCSIRRGDIDARSNLITVSGKVGERRVPISAEGLRWIQRWVSTHKHDRIFASNVGTMLDHANATRELRRLFEFAGVPIELAQWHHIRRYALRQYVEVAGLRGAQLLAGHSNQATTVRYLDADSELRALPHQSISPLARLSGLRRSR